jgi:membrane associated rhomboid family serine protease
MVAVPGWLPVEQLVVVVAFAVALAVVSLLHGDGIGRALRRRLLFGLPVGTLTVVGGVLAIYLFVQGGFGHWYRPVVIPFRAWSYLYPLGMLASGFSHTGPGHLTGNLIGTLVFGSLAEYAYGHFPTRRGTSSFGSRLSNPYVRAFVVVPGATVVAGLLTAAFSIGPVIGFSGVVFAYAGYALVSYPLTTVVASVATRVGTLLYQAMLDPEPVVESRPVFSTPWFAQIALQTHALGFLLGVLLGVYVARRRSRPTTPGLRSGRSPDWASPGGDSASSSTVPRSRSTASGPRSGATRSPSTDGGSSRSSAPESGSTDGGRGLPSPGRLWLAALVFVVANNFWAVYWFRGEGAFVLFRWIGAALVAGLATLVAVAVAGPDRPIVPRLAAPDPRTTMQAATSASPRLLAVFVVLVATAGLAGPAVPVNLATAQEGALPGDSLAVRDYRVTYAENVPNGMVGVIEFEAFGETTGVNTSGVIVESRDRGLWTTAVRKGQLALTGRSRVVLGGVGWRDEVVVTRTGWTVVGNATAYRVNLSHGGSEVTAYTSPPRQAEPVIAGRNVTVLTGDESFSLLVTRDDVEHRARLPAANESVVVDGVRFVHNDSKVFATVDDTRVRIAARETYRE